MQYRLQSRDAGSLFSFERAYIQSIHIEHVDPLASEGYKSIDKGSFLLFFSFTNRHPFSETKYFALVLTITQSNINLPPPQK